MKKDVIILKCKKCGEEFLYEYRGSGRKPDYCQECRLKLDKEAHEASKQKWQIKKANLMQQYQELQANKVQPNATMAVISTKAEAVNNSDACGEFADELIRLLRELDSLRVNMCNLATKLNQYQSTFDRNDQFYMHQLEDLDVANTAKMQELVKTWKNSRTNRRDVKDLINVVGNIITQIPYKTLANSMPILKRYNYKESIYDTRRIDL